MRRLVRIVVWVLVFAACAAVGAVVAANTNPFPPGVDDPGVRSSASASHAPSSLEPTPEPAGEAWYVRVDARTYHDLLVGGRCAANWRIDLGLEVVDGPIDSAGTAMLKSELRCDEPTAQVQAEQIELRAVGHLRDDEIHLSLDETGRSPVGSQELSGFLKTIPTLRLVMPARDGATASFDLELPDGGQGTFGAEGTVVLTAIAV